MVYVVLACLMAGFWGFGVICGLIIAGFSRDE